MKSGVIQRYVDGKGDFPLVVVLRFESDVDLNNHWSKTISWKDVSESFNKDVNRRIEIYKCGW